MNFVDTPILGVTIVELEPLRDDRGFFARAFSAPEFAEHGLASVVAQVNLSSNSVRGTVRGLHYQVSPAPEAKLIRCIAGAAHLVVVDMRDDSPTRLQHVAVELRRGDLRSLHVPELCAVGMQTLEDATELLYQVSGYYTPGAERGLRWNDPALGIDWPLPPSVISVKDAAWPLLDDDARR